MKSLPEEKIDRAGSKKKISSRCCVIRVSPSVMVSALPYMCRYVPIMSNFTTYATSPELRLDQLTLTNYTDD